MDIPPTFATVVSQSYTTNLTCLMEGEWLRECITLILLLLYRQYAHKQYFITVINRIRMESFLRVYLP